ncbi:NUDIX domain-containing protein [Candidatus Woesearchaeota archaeon]|nr:NUDIX domain-containing protein [Candidatus Woesearchaeota archaeon]
MEEEILDVVDEKDQFVRKATRKEVREKVLLHRVARVIIIGKNSELLIQKRSIMKDMFPGYYDIGLAETVKSGEGYESAAMRGLMEEFGIYGASNIRLTLSFLFRIKYESSQTREICKVYELFYDGKITAQKEEIDDFKFLGIQDIRKLAKDKPFHPAGLIAFNKYLELK